MTFVLVSSAGSREVYKRVEPTVIKSKYTGELEEIRQGAIQKMLYLLVPSVMMTTSASAATSTESAEKIRVGFGEILEVFTALAEPILWFYALTACILMVTKNKEIGWNRLKQVAYAYAAIALLPTFFSFLRWIADMLKGAITF